MIWRNNMFGLFGHGYGCECLQCKPTELGMRIRMKIPMDKHGNPRDMTRGEEIFMFICGFIMPVAMFVAFVGFLIYELI